MGKFRNIMTTIDTNPAKTIQFNPDKCSLLLTEIVELFQKHSPTEGEILVAYWNLGYTLGASIEGYIETGPSVEELKKSYYSKPTVGIALMLQGIEVTGWYQDHKKEITKEKDIKEKKE